MSLLRLVSIPLVGTLLLFMQVLTFPLEIFYGMRLMYIADSLHTLDSNCWLV